MVSSVPVFERVEMKNIEPTMSRELLHTPMVAWDWLILGTSTDNRWEVGFIGHSRRCRAAGYKGWVSKKQKIASHNGKTKETAWLRSVVVQIVLISGGLW